VASGVLPPSLYREEPNQAINVATTAGSWSTPSDGSRNSIADRLPETKHGAT
jgi:hypothetical protein